MRKAPPFTLPMTHDNGTLTPAWYEYFQGQLDIYNQAVKPQDGADPQNSTFGTIPAKPFTGQIVYLNAASGGSGAGVYYYNAAGAWVKLA